MPSGPTGNSGEREQSGDLPARYSGMLTRPQHEQITTEMPLLQDEGDRSAGIHPARTGPDANTADRVVAFFDIGTNSVRLLVVRIYANGSYRLLTRQKEVVRLGEGAFESGRLSPEAIERCVLVCRQLVALANSFEPAEVVAVATAATREADNGRELLSRLRHEAGIDVRMISGREEARLIYLGVASGVRVGEEPVLFIDIGGGSTEVILGDQRNYRFLESFRIGAIRLTNHFIGDQREKPVPAVLYDRIRNSVREEISGPAHEYTGEGISTGIGSSGSVINIAEIIEKAGIGVPGRSGRFSRQELRKCAAHLCSLPLGKRKTMPGINPDRADIIIAGMAILETIMDSFGVKEVLTTQRGLQDGLLEDYLRRCAGLPLLHHASFRERSIVQLGRSFMINEFHARTVTRLTLDLFDSALVIGIHAFGDPDRELLEYAAFLHDIGSFISYTNHHAHSFYIIKNVEIPGFSRPEQEVIAHITRFHRKKLPSRKSATVEELGPDLQKKVRVISMFLRLAESLDRSHAALVESARFRKRGRGGVSLEIVTRGDCQLEVWGVESEQQAFEKIFSMPLSLEISAREVLPGEGHRELSGDARSS